MVWKDGMEDSIDIVLVNAKATDEPLECLSCRLQHEVRGELT